MANGFPKLETLKIFLRPLPEKRPLRTRFDSQHVKASQILSNSPRERFFHVFSSFSGKLILKISLLELGKMLGVFLNTLTVDGRYPVQDCENLQLQIQMQLPAKRKTFSRFFVRFLESTSSFKHFQKRDDCHS